MENKFIRDIIDFFAEYGIVLTRGISSTQNQKKERYGVLLRTGEPVLQSNDMVQGYTVLWEITVYSKSPLEDKVEREIMQMFRHIFKCPLGMMGESITQVGVDLVIATRYTFAQPLQIEGRLQDL